MSEILGRSGYTYMYNEVSSEDFTVLDKRRNHNRSDRLFSRSLLFLQLLPLTQETRPLMHTGLNALSY